MFIKKLPSFSGTAANSTARVMLDSRAVYMHIVLATSLAAEQIAAVRLSLNGEVVYQLSGAEIVAMHQYKGLTAQSGQFVIQLADMAGRTLESASYTGLAVNPDDVLMLEVDIKQAESITLGGFAYVAQPYQREVLPKIQKMAISCHGSEFVLSGLHAKLGGGNVLLRRLHILSDKIESLQVVQGGIVLHDIDVKIDAAMQRNYGLVPQPNMTHFNPIMRGFLIRELERLGASTEIRGTLSAPADYVDVLVESVTALVSIPDGAQ